MQVEAEAQAKIIRQKKEQAAAESASAAEHARDASAAARDGEEAAVLAEKREAKRLAMGHAEEAKDMQLLIEESVANTTAELMRSLEVPELSSPVHSPQKQGARLSAGADGEDVLAKAQASKAEMLAAKRHAKHKAAEVLKARIAAAEVAARSAKLSSQKAAELSEDTAKKSMASKVRGVCLACIS